MVVLSLALLLLSVVASVAQEVDSSSLSIDTLSFIRSRKMSDADLAHKREGTFITGIPDFSSDPVTGFGVGVRTNIYWNGERTHPLFPYTAYLAKLKANAAYYTSNARELILSLDIPYFQGTRWRFKVDFKAQQNPANLYFGSTQSTLGALRLPSAANGGQTYGTFAAYDKARKRLRPGGESEAQLVTDALSNRFKETEYMLNLKADYALGNGLWRLLGGYEIQHLSYSTFTGVEAEALNPISGAETTAPNGLALLDRDAQQGLVQGYDGGWISLVQTALIFDSRDFEPDPTSGAYFEIANEYSGTAMGSQFDFNKLFLQGKLFIKLPIGPRTIFASRIGVGNIFGDQAPFFEFQDQWSPDGSINALGGKQSLRGFRANRFLARSMWFANLELRTRLIDFDLLSQHFGIGLAPFFDAGTVRDRWQDLNFEEVKISYGCGLRIAWNQSTLIYLDYGRSTEDNLVYFGIGQAF